MYQAPRPLPSRTRYLFSTRRLKCFLRVFRLTPVNFTISPIVTRPCSRAFSRISTDISDSKSSEAKLHTGSPGTPTSDSRCGESIFTGKPQDSSGQRNRRCGSLNSRCHGIGGIAGVHLSSQFHPRPRLLTRWEVPCLYGSIYSSRFSLAPQDRNPFLCPYDESLILKHCSAAVCIPFICMISIALRYPISLQ
jgi:hypothetical protein